MTIKADAEEQVMADSPDPAAKDTQVTGVHDIPPPPASVPPEELPVIHGRPRPAQPTLPRIFFRKLRIFTILRGTFHISANSYTTKCKTIICALLQLLVG
jgi:hypothetical protein